MNTCLRAFIHRPLRSAAAAAAASSSSSPSSRRILRESSLPLVAEILSINRTLHHSSCALHRHRSTSSSFSLSIAIVASLCNHSSLCCDRNFHKFVVVASRFAPGFARQQVDQGLLVGLFGTSSVRASSSLLGKSLPSPSPYCFPLSPSASTRLISTFHRAGMMVWVSDYDCDPKVSQLWRDSGRPAGIHPPSVVHSCVTNRKKAGCLDRTRGSRSSSRIRSSFVALDTVNKVVCQRGEFDRKCHRDRRNSRP